MRDFQYGGTQLFHGGSCFCHAAGLAFSPLAGGIDFLRKLRGGAFRHGHHGAQAARGLPHAFAAGFLRLCSGFFRRVA